MAEEPPRGSYAMKYVKYVQVCPVLKSDIAEIFELDKSSRRRV